MCDGMCHAPRLMLDAALLLELRLQVLVEGVALASGPYTRPLFSST